MATDILTTAMAPSRSPYPRGLAITDLDLRDDRYPLISPPRRVSPAAHQGTPSANEASSHTQFYSDAVHQAVRGPSLPSSHLLPHDMKNVDTPPLASTSAQPDTRQVSDDRRSTLQPDSQSPPLNPGSRSTSYPLDHRQPSNSPPPPSVNEINLQLFRPSQTSQSSSGEVSKAPPPPDAPLPSHHPRALQPGVPWQTSPQDSYPTELYTPSRSFAAGSQLPSPLSPAMRMSSAAQYSPVSVSPNPRVQAQQPTYINPSQVPAPINPIQPLPAEEVCAECAMRDQDMVDVDVTSRGIWARESDVQYEDLLRRELEEEAMCVQPQDQHRPRARGGRLTTANLKLWLCLNPKEPASKSEALEKYVKAQQNLVEAETLAHARAVLESRQLEDRLRDVYSQLRRSAYELGTTSPDDRGVRIRNPHASVLPLPSQPNGHSREVTMLENGMVVEHLNVRREERDDRQQRRREEKRARARKSSRGSAYDVSSMLSNPLPHTDSGLPLLPLRSSTSRPMSVLTSPTMGMQSNPSIEALSMISAGASPRQTRFFGMQNLTPSFRSSDSLAPSGFSGSMVDMHLALQPGRERVTQSPIESGYQIVDNWQDSPALIPQRRVDKKPEDKPKKRKGLSRIWGFVTGTSKLETGAPPDKSQRRSFDRVHVDDYPLAPPPPLSYLVGRGTSDNGGSALRHVSTPSLPSSVSPNYPLSSASPPTAPSSLLPSPTSSRPVIIPELSDYRKAPPVLPDSDAEQQPSPVPEEDNLQTSAAQRSVHPTTSEPDLRHRASQLQNSPVPPVPRVPTSVTHASGEPSVGAWREKILPPLPGEIQPRPIAVSQGEIRPRTLYDMREVDGGQPLTAPSAQFAYAERRRQSFNGLSNFPSGLVTQTMPARRTGFDPEKYGAFGGSHSALVSATPRMQQPPKRKSKFGFAALLGRKSSVPVPDPEPVEFPLVRSSASDARHEAELGMLYGNGEAGQQGQTFPRLSMSLTSRKNLESLVDQSPDFVAYRYPSGNQNLPLLQ